MSSGSADTTVFRRLGAGFCFFWAIFCVFPIWWVLVTAFKPPTAVNEGPTYIPFVDFQPTLDAFRDALAGNRGDFFRPIVNSMLISVSATMAAVLLGAMAAYALVRFTFRIKLAAAVLFAVVSIGGFAVLNMTMGISVPVAFALTIVVALVVAPLVNRFHLPGPEFGNNDVTFWFVSQRMFPPIVSAFALFLLYAELGKVGLKVLDSYAGMVIAYTAFGLPFAVWLMRDFFQTLPLEVEEAALVDNIGRIRIFFQIVLPMSLSGLVATTMIVLAFIWNEFLFALLLTSSDRQTLPILLAGQNSSRGDEWWAISVATLVSIAPMIIIALILGRMMRGGLLTGSIK